MCLTQEWGVAWDLREMGSAQGKGVREGQAPQARREISSQPPARTESTWSRKKKEERVRHDEEGPACTEWVSSKRLFNDVIVCLLMILKLMLHLFQENKSYGVKPICIHPMMSRHCTSLRHIWHNKQCYSRLKRPYIQYVCASIIRSNLKLFSSLFGPSGSQIARNDFKIGISPRIVIPHSKITLVGGGGIRVPWGTEWWKKTGGK